LPLARGEHPELGLNHRSHSPLSRKVSHFSSTARCAFQPTFTQNRSLYGHLNIYIVQATKPEQSADHLKSVEWELTAEELKTLDELSAPPRPYPHWILDFTQRDRTSPEGLLT